MGRRLVVGSLVFALAGLGVAGLPSTAAAGSGSESKFVSLINQERKERGIKILVVKGDLTAIARKHSARMAADGTIYHNSNLGKEVPGNWWAAGENVGMGPSVDSLHQAFMDSPGHRANIIDRDYNQIGVGVVVKDETIYVTEVFAGRPSGAKPKVVIKTVPAPPKEPERRVIPPPTPAPRTMAILLLLAGLDARRINPANGRALGV